MSLKVTIKEDMKAAMKAHEKVRLSTIRLLMAAMKQKEVDERIELDDTAIIAIVDKMIKQRKDSIAQYQQANRADLVEQEQAEVDVLHHYLPKALTEDEIHQLIDAAMAKVDAKGMQDMGKVMGELRPQLAGRADMAVVSAMIKTRLSK